MSEESGADEKKQDSDLETTVVGGDGMPTYTASDGSKWDLYCGSGSDIEDILDVLNENPELWLPPSDASEN